MVGPRARAYWLPLLSTTDETVAVVLFQPTATTFRFPATCAFERVTATVFEDVSGVAAVACTNLIDAGWETGLTVTTAKADIVASAWLVALTVTLVTAETDGAVNSPPVVIVPALADHVTAVFDELVTVEPNCCCPPDTSATEDGATATTTGGMTVIVA